MTQFMIFGLGLFMGVGFTLIAVKAFSRTLSQPCQMASNAECTRIQHSEPCVLKEYEDLRKMMIVREYIEKLDLNKSTESKVLKELEHEIEYLEYQVIKILGKQEYKKILGE